MRRYGQLFARFITISNVSVYVERANYIYTSILGRFSCHSPPLCLRPHGSLSLTVKSDLGSNSLYNTPQAGIQNLTSRIKETFLFTIFSAVICTMQNNIVAEVGALSISGRNGNLAAVTELPVVAVPIGFNPATDAATNSIIIGMELLWPKWTEQQLLQTAYHMRIIRRARKMPIRAKRRNVFK